MASFARMLSAITMTMTGIAAQRWQLGKSRIGTVFALCDVHALEHRMDQLNQGSNAAWSELTGLTSNGVILWHLHLPSSGNGMWCLVFEFSDGFHLVLDDDPVGTNTYMLAEQHADIVTVLNRADTIKGSLLRCGWADIDVE